MEKFLLFIVVSVRMAVVVNAFFHILSKEMAMNNMAIELAALNRNTHRNEHMHTKVKNWKSILKRKNSHLKCCKPTIFRIYFVVFGLNSTCTHILFLSFFVCVCVIYSLLTMCECWWCCCFPYVYGVFTFCNAILHFRIYYWVDNALKKYTCTCTHA